MKCKWRGRRRASDKKSEKRRKNEKCLREKKNEMKQEKGKKEMEKEKVKKRQMKVNKGKGHGRWAGEKAKRENGKRGGKMGRKTEGEKK